MTVLPKPCFGCPYRKDCPSGVWDRSEYQKLAEYDRDTSEQPPGAFLCHDADRESTLCRGWLDCHDKPNLLSLRMLVSMGKANPNIFEFPPGSVPVFESGDAAMKHGMQRLKMPGKAAIELQRKIVRRHPELKS
jgi:hypothetical protein